MYCQASGRTSRNLVILILALVLVLTLVPLPIAARAQSAGLAVPMIKQQFEPAEWTGMNYDSGTFDCLIASVAMVLQSLQQRSIISNAIVDYASIRKEFRKESPNANQGITPNLTDSIVKKITNNILIPTTSTFDENHWEDVVTQQLQAGYPVIAHVLNWNLLKAHWSPPGYAHSVVIYNLHGEDISYNDPWDGKTYTMPTSDFAIAWGYAKKPKDLSLEHPTYWATIFQNNSETQQPTAEALPTGTTVPVATPTASSVPTSVPTMQQASQASSDWSMAGANLENTSWNMGETTLAPPLTQSWHWQRENYSVDGVTIANGIVYVSGEFVSNPTTKEDHNRIFALDATTGSELWDFTLIKGIGAMDNEPAIGDGSIYFGGQQDDLLYALNSVSGQQVWTLDGMGIGGLYDRSPKYENGILYVQTSSGSKGLIAVEAKTGKLLWSFPGSSAQAQIAVTDKLIIRGGLCCNETSLRAFNKQTGQAVWVWPDAPVGAKVVVGSNQVFTTIFSDKSKTYQSVAAFNISDGKQLWRHDFGSDIGYGPIAFAYDTLYVGSFAGSNQNGQGILYALDPKNGALKAQFNTGQPNISDIVIANGFVYAVSFNGSLSAFNPTSLQPTMQLPISGERLAIAEGRLFVAAAWQGVYAYGNATDQPPANPTAAAAFVEGTWTRYKSSGPECDALSPQTLSFLSNGVYDGESNTVLPGGKYEESLRPSQLKIDTSNGVAVLSFVGLFSVRTDIGLRDVLNIKYSKSCVFQYSRPHQ